jgi:hypothetical protein
MGRAEPQARRVRAHCRLSARYRALTRKGKLKTVAATGVAREFSAFIWAINRQISNPLAAHWLPDRFVSTQVLPRKPSYLACAAAWPFVARAQQGDRVRRIGVLLRGDEKDPVVKSDVSAFMPRVISSAENGAFEPYRVDNHQRGF